MGEMVEEESGKAGRGGEGRHTIPTKLSFKTITIKERKQNEGNWGVGQNRPQRVGLIV